MCVSLSGTCTNHGVQVSLQNCTVSQNEAQVYGGGVALSGNTTLHILSSSASWNTAQLGGGLAADDNSSSFISNATVSGNAATKSGGGLYVDGLAQVRAQIYA